MDSEAAELHHKALMIGKIYFQGNLKTSEAQEYLKKRGVDAAAARKFELGYAPDEWRGLVDHFSSHRIRLAAKDAGLLTTVGTSNRLLDFFRHRLIFPIRDHEGALVGYGGRLTVEKEGSPKYMNTPETALFQKGCLLYGLHQHRDQIRQQREAIIVEGYMDVVRLSASGFETAVAPMGTALTSEQIQLLLDAGVTRLMVCLDGDAAGRKAATRSIESIMAHYHPAMEIMLVSMPEGHDPDSLIRAEGPEAFAACLGSALPLAEHIHNTCCEGFSPSPCLEDKALYLLRLEPFIAQAGGFLQHRLIDQASRFTGLPAKNICADRQSVQVNEAIARWHPLAALAARWLMHDPAQERIARYLGQFSSPRMGVDELAEMARDIQAKRQPDSPIAQFARAHGPLEPEEFDRIYAELRPWLRSVQIDHSLKSLSRMPLDEDAKKSVRAMLRL